MSFLGVSCNPCGPPPCARQCAEGVQMNYNDNSGGHWYDNAFFQSLANAGTQALVNRIGSWGGPSQQQQTEWQQDQMKQSQQMNTMLMIGAAVVLLVVVMKK